MRNTYPKSRRLSNLLPTLALALMACQSTDPQPSGKPDPVKRSPDEFRILGPWTETLRDDVIYFAGRLLSFDFETDSVTIRDYQFTDVMDCQIVAGERRCSDIHWTNTYRGTWTLQGATLHIDFHFAHTTASSWTENTPLGATTASFEVIPAEDRDDLLWLKRTSPGEFMVNGKDFHLSRPE